MNKIILAIALCICAISASFAYADNLAVNTNQKHHKHIKQGIKSGKTIKAQPPQKRFLKGERQQKHSAINTGGKKSLPIHNSTLQGQNLNQQK
jgi:hypothetical protein